MSERDNIGARIEAAFANAPSPGEASGDISATRNDEGIVEYFRGTTWRGHAVADLRYHSAALSFFTDAAFRYWLPAFMLASIEDPVAADVIPDGIAFHMRDPRRRALFSKAEIETIDAFLDELELRNPAAVVSPFTSTSESHVCRSNALSDNPNGLAASQVAGGLARRVSLTVGSRRSRGGQARRLPEGALRQVCAAKCARVGSRAA